MAGYLVLARKYRSETFDELVGQEPIAQTLKNAIKTGRVAHAYLFTGTRGVGKTTVARILAKALNCLNHDQPTDSPCNRCDACKAIARGEDIDVVEIDGASNRGIDEIRELRASAIFRPARSRYKIYYIDEVHMLTREAFNALLKTLEEPPEHVKFIFATTDAEKIPATILSRCQRFDFRNIPTRLIVQHLRKICQAEKVDVDDGALFRIARAAAGSMRDGLSLLDQLLAAGAGKVAEQDALRALGAPPDERMLALARAIADGSAAAALVELNATLEAGVALSSAATALAEVFRNLMLAAACGGDSELIELPEAQRQEVAELAGRFSLPALVQAVGICQNLTRTLRATSVARALVEAAVVRLAEADKFVDPASLVERLEALAAGRSAGAAQKKNPPIGSPGGPSAPGPARTGPEASPQAPAAAPPPIQWQQQWLQANWATVVDHLTARRMMQLAGLLRSGKVLDFADGLLRLGYDAQHEALHRSACGPCREAIDAALSDLAGRPIRCEHVLDGAGAAPVGAGVALSTAEKNELAKDPTVRAVLDLFGGEIVDIRRQAGAFEQAGAGEGD